MLQWLQSTAEQSLQLTVVHPLFMVALALIGIMAFTMPIFRLRWPAKKTSEALWKAAPNNQSPEFYTSSLWDYAKHIDNIFGDRQNFFLLFQSILLGGIFVAESSSSASSQALQAALPVVALLGLAITLVWWYVQFRCAYILDCVVNYHREHMPTYRDLIAPIRDKPFGLSSTAFQAYYLPLAVAALWGVVLAVI